MARPQHHRLLLLRHAQTELNRSGRLRGHLDPPLNTTGEREAAELARVIAEFAPRWIVSSPLQRAVSTAKPLSQLTGQPIDTDPRLVDRDYGHWASWLKTDVEAQWGTLDRAPGVEASDLVTSRMCEILDEQLERLHHGPVVLVSHDATNSALLAALDPTLGEASTITQHTACWNMLHHEDDSGWIVDRVNQVAGAISQSGAPS